MTPLPLIGIKISPSESTLRASAIDIPSVESACIIADIEYRYK